MNKKQFISKEQIPVVISLLFIIYLFFFLTPFAESEGLFQMGHRAYPSSKYKVASILPSILYYIYVIYGLYYSFSTNKKMCRHILFPACIIACADSFILLCGQGAGFILMFLFFPTIFFAIVAFFVGLFWEIDISKKEKETIKNNLIN